MEGSEILTEQIRYCPHSVRHPRRYCRRSAFERDVFATEVIPREVQRERRAKMVPFLGEPVVRRVSLRMHMRIVKFWRSTCDVQIFFSSGSP